MRNKFKLKKKLVSIALALVLAAQPLATLPMNVFAGTGKNGMLTAPLKADLKELNYDQQVTSKYIVQKSVDFSDTKVLSARIVQAPGIVYAKEKIGNSMRDVYIIADINGMLNAAAAAAAKADDTIKVPFTTDIMAANDAAQAAAQAANAAANVANAAANVANAESNAANAAANVAQPALKTAWNVAEKACESAEIALGKGLALEVKLKIAYMAYRVAEAVWAHLGDPQGDLDACKGRADALQEVINACYSDKVE